MNEILYESYSSTLTHADECNKWINGTLESDAHDDVIKFHMENFLQYFTDWAKHGKSNLFQNMLQTVGNLHPLQFHT